MAVRWWALGTAFLLLVSFPALPAFAGEDYEDESYVDEETEDEGEEFDKTGWYLGLAGVYAIEDIKNQGKVDPESGLGPFDYDNELGVNVRVGYRPLPRLGIEGQFEWVSWDDDKSGNDVETYASTFNVRGYFFTGRYQPYALIGVGGMAADYDKSSDEWDIVMRSGGGIDVMITDSLVAVMEATYLAGFEDVQDLDYFSLTWGLSYRF